MATSSSSNQGDIPLLKTNGHSAALANITDDEAALYDRQIRLWGVDAQKRLRACNVLLFGLSGVGSEVTKNIVLAGINSLTIVDSEIVTEDDSLSNLFTNHQLGKNRATASEANVQILNPMVSVTTKDWNLNELLEEEGQVRLLELLKGVNVVCLCNAGKETAIRLNNLTRSFERKVLFYWTSTWGFYGFSFSDLGKKHQYIVEEVIEKETATMVDLDGEPSAAKKPKTVEQEKQLVEKTLDYPSLQTALAVKAGKVGFGLTKRITPVFVLTHIMLAFKEKYGRYPDDRTVDIEELKALQTELVEEKLNLDESVSKKLDELEWWNSIYGEISPVTSVVGGVLGQDIIRAVSAKETPIKNFFLFNGAACNGIIENVGR